MDIGYYEEGYTDFHYFNYIASGTSTMTAFDLIQISYNVIHLMRSLTYRIREETRLLNIREETRIKKITEETRLYNIK